MRKYTLYILLLSLALVSCKQGKKDLPAVEKAYELPERKITLERDTILWGRLGEETAMSSLQLITNDGDTLQILKSSPTDGAMGNFLGNVRNYSDRVYVQAFIYSDQQMSVETFLNVTQMESEWISNDLSLRLYPDSTFNCKDMKYSKWYIERGKLLLEGISTTEYGTTQNVDTARIERLDNDSMYLNIPRHGQLKLGRSKS